MIPSAISVIVPTRNRAAVLSASLASIARQVTESPFEVVVVDNDSSDDTATVVRAWCERDRRFRAITETRLGRSPAMNAGLAVATGALLAFTDDDVELAPGWLEGFRTFFTAHEGALVVAGGAIEPAPPDLSSWPPWLSDASLVDGPGLDHGREQRPLAAHEFLWGASMAVPADVFGRLGTWNEAVGRRGDHRGTYEDTEFQQRLRRAGGEVWYVPASRLRHRVARTQVTPRRVLDGAYRRGRNAAWFPPQGDPPPRASAVSAARSYARWLWASMGFRARGTAARFDLARMAASTAGERGERVALGHRRARAALQRASWFAARLILRLVPDRP